MGCSQIICMAEALVLSGLHVLEVDGVATQVELLPLWLAERLFRTTAAAASL